LAEAWLEYSSRLGPDDDGSLALADGDGQLERILPFEENEYRERYLLTTYWSEST
jgi:hypothetical protein